MIVELPNKHKASGLLEEVCENTHPVMALHLQRYLLEMDTLAERVDPSRLEGPDLKKVRETLSSQIALFAGLAGNRLHDTYVTTGPDTWISHHEFVDLLETAGAVQTVAEMGFGERCKAIAREYTKAKADIEKI